MFPCPKPFLLPVLVIALWFALGDRVMAQSPEAAADVRQRLADAELESRLLVDRVEMATPFLKLLAEVANGPASDERQALVTEITKALVDRLVAADDSELALGMLMPQPHSGDADSAFTPEGREAWNDVLASPEIDALREALRAFQLAEARKRAADEQAGSEIGQTVKGLLEAGDVRAIEELGQRAVPALVALRDPGRTLPIDERNDPYWHLALIDPEVLIRQLHDDVTSGALMARGRAVLAVAQVLGRSRDAWLNYDGRPSRLASQELHDVVTVLFADAPLFETPGAASHALYQMVGEFTERDAFDAEQARNLGRSGLLLSAESALKLVRWMQEGDLVTPSARPGHEILVDHRDDLVRRHVAGSLMLLPEPTRLLDLVDDPDPGVREEVARWFTNRQRSESQFQRNGARRITLEPVTSLPEPAHLQVLVTLARDRVSPVRRVAAQGVVDRHERLADEIYLELANDADPRVRGVMTSVSHPDPELQARLVLDLADDPDPVVRAAVTERTDLDPELRGLVLVDQASDPDPAVRELVARSLSDAPNAYVGAGVALAMAADPDPRVRAWAAITPWSGLDVQLQVLGRSVRDPDPKVRAYADQRLIDLLRSGTWREDPDGVLARIEERRSVAGDPGPWAARSPEGTYDTLLREPETTAALTRWIIADGTDAAWEELLTKQPSNGKVNHNLRETQSLRDGWMLLDDDDLETALRRAALRSPPLLEYVGERLVPLPEERQELGLRLFADHGNSLTLGSLGAQAAARRATAADLAALDAFVLEADRAREALGWPEGDVGAARIFRPITEALPDDVVNTWLAGRIADGTLSDRTRYSLAARLRPDAPGEAALCRVIIANYGDQHLSNQVEFAVRRLVEVTRGLPADDPQALSTDELIGLVLGPYGDKSPLKELAARRDERGFAFLVEWIDRPSELATHWAASGSASGNEMTFARSMLVDGLVAHLSDEAAEVLLSAASRAPSSAHRSALMSGVTRIQEFQDARAAWDQRLSNRATRDKAIYETLVLLEDEDPTIRAAAATSLATLGAVEHLPALIRMLRDEDPEVVQVVARAIEDLNRRARDDG